MATTMTNLGNLTECDKDPNSNNAKHGRFVPGSEQNDLIHHHHVDQLITTKLATKCKLFT